MTGNLDFLLPPELVDLARRVIEANRAAGRRVAVAESCTGGLVAAALTEIAGSSDVFEAGFVTYSNEAKTKLLHVSDDVLETFGSVSVATAWAMAQGALAASGADVAVALTGIAMTVARLTGIALLALGVACWTGTPLIGMLTYGAAVTLYLAYVGFAGGSTGILLWPAVVLHTILTGLLTRARAKRHH